MNRLGWALAGALSIVVVLSAARAMQAGPLDPPGPVGSTMRSLDELLPSWGKTLSATGGCDSQRFDCVLGDLAVLDRETGLVWDRAPDATNRDWDTAHRFCAARNIGGRQGWRLPSLSEQQSLLDGTALPTGHPFTLPILPSFWTTTPADGAPDEIFAVFFSNGTTQTRMSAQALKAWCVRGSGTGDGSAVERRDDPFGSWSSSLSASGPVAIDSCNSYRFRCVLGGAAVLDNETGLVWQLAPAAATDTWSNALSRCDEAKIGGRMGWRLPTVDELTSLIDPASNAGGVTLPAGHPFVLPASPLFWSTNRYGGTSENREGVDFSAAAIGDPVSSLSTAGAPQHYWCVRGGAGKHPD